MKVMRWICQTLIGRLVLGPFRSLFLTWNHRRNISIKDWLIHLAMSGLVIVWVVGVCEIPLIEYLLFFVYPGVSLTLLRSYVEHRPTGSAGQRTAIVESGRLLSLIFLNNNYHAVHHSHPSLAWYQIPRTFRENREQILEDNGGFHFRGYGQVIARFALRPKDHPVYPRP